MESLLSSKPQFPYVIEESGSEWWLLLLQPQSQSGAECMHVPGEPPINQRPHRSREGGVAETLPRARACRRHPSPWAASGARDPAEEQLGSKEEGGGRALSPSAAPPLSQAWDPLTQRGTLSPEKDETQEGRRVGRRLEVKFYETYRIQQMWPWTAYKS